MADFMDNLTQEEKQKAIKEFEAKQVRQYKTGKVIVFMIAAINIIMAFISAFTSFNLLSLIVQVALSIALFMGVSWVRYLFAISSALSVLIILFSFVNISSERVPVNVAVVSLIIVAYSVTSTLLLLINKSVSEFLYSQKNG